LGGDPEAATGQGDRETEKKKKGYRKDKCSERASRGDECRKRSCGGKTDKVGGVSQRT